MAEQNQNNEPKRKASNALRKTGGFAKSALNKIPGVGKTLSNGGRMAKNLLSGKVSAKDVANLALSGFKFGFKFLKRKKLLKILLLLIFLSLFVFFSIEMEKRFAALEWCSFSKRI